MTLQKVFRFTIKSICLASMLLQINSANAMFIQEPRHYDIQSLLNTITKDILDLVFRKGINFTQPIEQTSPLRKLAYLDPSASDYSSDYLVVFVDNFKSSFLEYIEDFDSCIGTLNGPSDCVRKIFEPYPWWEDSTGECLHTWWMNRGKAHALAELDHIEISAGSRYDESIQIKNTDTGECIGTKKFLFFWRHACVKLDNYHLASGSADNTIKIWELRMDMPPLQRLLIGHLQMFAKNNQTITLHDDWKAMLPEQWAKKFAHILI